MPIDAIQARAIVGSGILAPSGGNCQPWRFVLDDDGSLLCSYDPVRAENFLDFDSLASHIALGAAIENMAIAAAAMGLGCRVEPPDDDAAPELAARLHFDDGTASADDAELAPQIPRRATNRRIGKRTKVSGESLERMRDAAQRHGAELQVAADPATLEELRHVVAACDRFRLYSKTMHREMMAELRWTADEAERTGDGIDVRSLGMSSAELPVLGLLRSWPVVRALRALRVRRPIELLSGRWIDSASLVGLLTVGGVARRDYLRGGRALQRLWLTATGLGLAFQPLAVAPYLFARLERGSGFSPGEQAALASLRARFSQCFTTREDAGEVMLFRITEAPADQIRSTRLPLEMVLTTPCSPRQQEIYEGSRESASE